MIHQRLLRQAVQGRDPILVEFVETIAPKILEHFATVPALGGSGQPRPAPAFEIPPKMRRYSEIELARFGASNPDQSMATHILNGIFAGMRIAEKLPAPKALNAAEKRLWMLGYVIHDYTKVYGLQVPAGELPAIRQLVARLGAQLNFGSFISDWQNWLDDIVWLGQNTQTREGANLNTRDYPNLKTPLRRLEVLRILSSYTDILVHIQSPSEVLISTTHKTAENMREKLEILFGAGNAPRLTYHKLTEVRGLLSNLINNAVMDALAEQGFEPYLFFPNGVVYLTRPHHAPQIEMDTILNGIWTRVADILTSNEEIGIKRDGKGLKVAPAMYELVDLAGLLRVGEQAAMRIKNSSAEDRVDAKRVMKEKLVADLRTDRLAEFLVFVKRRVFDERFPKAGGVTEMLLDTLKLTKKITPSETEEQSGGVLLGWWYVAARYLADHRGLDGDTGLPEILEDISAHALEFIRKQKLETNQNAPIRQAFFDYARRLIEIDGQAVPPELKGFEQELEIYLERKVRNKPICSLCSSAYAAIEQPETSVLFKPQQYSNKTQLGSTMLRRGICPICTVEMMLRLVQQGAPGKAFQDQKPIYLWLYPTYFFTSETASVVKSYINELEDLNIFALLNHLRKNGFNLSNLFTFEGFIQGAEATHSFTLIRQKYSEHDNAALFNFALRPLGKSPTDTDAWIVPALYALALPLLLDLKVVVTPSFVPIFGTGADFQETAVLDAPHQFTRYALGRDRFRVDELEANLFKLLALYDLHVDVLAERTNLHWGQLNAVAKDIDTDPNYVFAYYERKERDPQKKAEMSHYIVKRYFEIYRTLGGDVQMGLFGGLVDAYAQFYRADWGKLGSAYGVLKPLAEAIDVTTESNPKTQTDDLTLLVAGAIGDLMERVWGGQADGFDPIVFSKDSGLGGNERRALSREKQMTFARLFVEKAFLDYCDGDRGLLRERANRMRSAARFYYLSNYGYTKKEANNGKPE
ncbi:MAG: type I-D CRISPR-associated protein Cas10d/Csc3 [Chloroflexi bacterium]|nr:type I-D CRISPR-associated protein Cas10d/Csc3 [Chloroflexota bacterium]